MILVNRIISINRTTLEYCESKKLDPSDDSSVFDNFTAVFGTNPFIWFLPLCKPLMLHDLYRTRPQARARPMNIIKQYK